MPRKHEGRHCTTAQKGRAKGPGVMWGGTSGVGAYCRKRKSRQADHYDRPYADGSYRQWDSQGGNDRPIALRERRIVASGHHESYGRTDKSNSNRKKAA